MIYPVQTHATYVYTPSTHMAPAHKQPVSHYEQMISTGGKSQLAHKTSDPDKIHTATLDSHQSVIKLQHQVERWDIGR